MTSCHSPGTFNEISAKPLYFPVGLDCCIFIGKEENFIDVDIDIDIAVDIDVDTDKCRHRYW